MYVTNLILSSGNYHFSNMLNFNSIFKLRFADFHKMPLFETSAKDDDKAYHVEAIFVTLAHKIKKRNTKSSFVDSTKGKTKAVVYNVKDVNGEVERKCFFC